MANFKDRLKQALESVAGNLNLEADKVEVNYPKAEEFGDYVTNLAMQSGKSAGVSPMDLAEQIKADFLATQDLAENFEKIEAVRPGFLNFHLKGEYLAKQIKEILSSSERYGRQNVGNGQKINLEFISANPTGPLTVGNGRGGFPGDVLASVMKECGYEVGKEYLVNDAGNQIRALGHSVLKDDEAVYKGDYIDELHDRLKGESDPFKVGRQAAKIILEEILKETVEGKMQIKFDVWFSEYDNFHQTGKIVEVVEQLKEKNYLYEEEGALWFKSSEHGDDRDRVLVKSNGDFTYLAQDFAYLKSKLEERKFDKAIYIWGADHHGDVKGLLAASEVLGFKGKVEIIIIQFVKLFKDGKEVRMSKRRGTYVTVDDLIEIVGHDVARFSLLMYGNNTHIDFDLNKAQEKSDSNPVYYVQYAFARLSGILRQMEEQNLADKTENSEIIFEHDKEKSLVKSLLKYPEILAETASDYQTQRLPNYALELADKFHQFYGNCKVIEDGKLNASRLALVRLTQKILKEALEIIGIQAPEKM